MKYVLASLFIWMCSVSAWAMTPLPAEQAFALTSEVNSNHMLVLSWRIADGYHLYKDSIKVVPTAKNTVLLGEYVLPASETLQNAAQGHEQVYDHGLSIAVPLLNPDTGKLIVDVHYQGCASSGYCYAPMTVRVQGDMAVPSTIKQHDPLAPSSAQDHIASLFSQHNIVWVWLVLIGLGVLLTFTPCVLPMIPILSGIILGQRATMTTQRAFLLSLTYVIAMALTYAVAGVIVALLGAQVQAAMQSPVIISIFAAIFVLLALSLFGFYELRIPTFIESRLTHVSNRQRRGSFVGVFVMGVLATLIVSPCVSAPLVGVLLYIAHTGDVFVGGTALFALGIGMGIPLLIVGTSTGRFLPKAGRWMTVVKAIVGVALLMVALALLSRVLSATVMMLLWAVLCILVAVAMGALTRTKGMVLRLTRGVALIVLLYGVALLVGAWQGNDDYLRPLQSHAQQHDVSAPMTRVSTVSALDRALASAKRAGKPVILDFWAQWCTSCQLMDRTVFSDARVMRALQGYDWIKVDVTQNTDETRALRARYQVIGTPTFLFISTKGKLLPRYTTVGEVTLPALLSLVTAVNVVAYD